MTWLALACFWNAFPDFERFRWPESNGLIRIVGKPGLMVTGPGGHHLAPDGKSVAIDGLWYDPASQKPIPPLLVNPPKGYALQQIFSNNELVLKKGNKYELRPAYKEKSRAWFESEDDVEFSPNGKFALRVFSIRHEPTDDANLTGIHRLQLLDLTDDGKLAGWKTLNEREVQDTRWGTIFEINHTGSHIAHWNREDFKLYLYDLKSHETKPLAWSGDGNGKPAEGIQCLALAPDGKTVAILSDRKLELIDVEKGTSTEKKDVGEKQNTSLEFHPDSRSVYFFQKYYDYWFRIPIDGESAPKRESARCGIQRFEFSDDGKRLAIADNGERLHVFDPDTLKPRGGESVLPRFDYLYPIDSETALAWNPQGELIRFQTRTGIILERHRWSRAELGIDSASLAPAPDGETFLLDRDQSTGLFDTRTGKMIREHPKYILRSTPAFTPNGDRYRLWLTVRAAQNRDEYVAASFDAAGGEPVANRGKMEVVTRSVSADQKIRFDWSAFTFEVQEFQTGAMRWFKDLRTEPLKLDGNKQIRYAGLSNDGRIAIVAGVGELRTYDATNGVKLASRSHELPNNFFRDHALSPTGRWLIEWGGGLDGFSILDVGGVRAVPEDFTGLGPEKISAVAWTPNGKTLLVGCADGAIRVYDFQKLLKSRPEKKLFFDDWEALLNPEGGEALLRLYREPLKALELLKAKLKPAALGDASKWQTWIGELGSKDFKTREAASKALAAEFDQAESRLVRALKDAVEEEAAQRLKLLLEQGRAKPAPEQLRESRAVELLEKFGDADSKKLLEALAAGAPMANLTREAKAALKRMKERE